MTSIKRYVELQASAGRRSLTVEGFECPSCNGRGCHFDGIGHGDYKERTCNTCKGTGRMRGLVEIACVADERS